MMANRRTGGFTLLELLVVLMVMSLIAGVVVPAYSKSMTSLDLRKSARHVAAVLKESRNVAVFQSQTVQFYLDEETHGFQSDVSRGSYPLPADLVATLEGIAGEPKIQAAILFFSDGTSSGGQVRLVLEESSQLVSVDWMTGAVSID